MQSQKGTMQKSSCPCKHPESNPLLSSQFWCQATVVWRLVGCCPCCNEWEEADSGMVETFTSSSPAMGIPPRPVLCCGGRFKSKKLLFEVGFAVWFKCMMLLRGKAIQG